MVAFSEILPIYWKFEANGKEDRLRAILAIEGDLGNIEVVGKYKWNDSLFPKFPTSLLPKTEKNAEMINEILIKSWETQGSIAPKSALLLLMKLVLNCL